MTLKLNNDAQISNLNAAKSAILRQMWTDGVITPEVYENYKYNYGLIILEKSWFQKLKDKLSKDTESIVVAIQLPNS